MEFGWSDDEVRFRRELTAFLDAELPGDWEQRTRGGPGSEAQVAFCRGFCPKLAARGWLTPHWPEAWGGQGASPWRHAILGEEMWARGEPRGPQYMNVNWIGPTILEFGTPEQKQELLPPIARGEALWCQGFSEPDAGSDLAALRTLALPSGDAYRVNGTKLWTSYANHAERCFLLARSDPDSKRQHGLTVLLVPMRLPGIEVREIPSVVGERYFHEVVLCDVEVPARWRLGPEGEGWSVVTWALQYERVGAARYARAARTLDALVLRLRALGRLGEPGLLGLLAEARGACEAARVLAWRVVDQRAHGLPPSADANAARVAGTRAERAVSELSLDVLGPGALETASLADAHFRLAMTAGVAVGATEVQLDLVARRMLGLPRE